MTQKFLHHISRLHAYKYFAHPIDFFALSILQKLQIYHEWFLFSGIPDVDAINQ